MKNKADAEWTTGSSLTMQVSGNQERIVYARAANGAGLVSYISSDGIVYDTTAPLISGVENDGEYYQSSVDVEISDSYLGEVKLDGIEQDFSGNTLTLQLPAAETSHVIEAVDMTGNRTIYTVKVTEPSVDLLTGTILFDSQIYGDTPETKPMSGSNQGSITIRITGASFDEEGAKYFDCTANQNLEMGLGSYEEYLCSVTPKSGLNADTYSGILRLSYDILNEERTEVVATGYKEQNITYTVMKKPLTMKEAEITIEKDYDGTVSAASGTASIEGILGDDIVTVTTSANYEDADAGENKRILINYTFAGQDIGNYIMPTPKITYLTGRINKASWQPSVSMAHWNEGENASNPQISSSIPETSGVVYYYKLKSAADNTYTTAKPTTKGTYIVRAVVPESNNYLESSATAEFTIGVLPTPVIPYTLNGTTGSNGWYTSNVAIIPVQGYQISRSRTSGYADSLTIEATTAASTIYLRSETGAWTDAISIPAIRIDKTTPAYSAGTGIVVGDTGWNRFLTTITFNRFYTEATTVQINAGDEESSVTRYEYLLSSTPQSLEQLTQSSSWITGSSFVITPQMMQEMIIYARVTNEAGLVSYISSDGIVYDTQAPTIANVADGGTYYGTRQITVSDDYLSSVTVNGEALNVSGSTTTFACEPADTPYIIEAIDKTGNTVNASILVLDTWVQEGITTSGTKRLIVGIQYHFGGGQWVVSGDSTVYQGGTSFYATTNGEIELQKQE